jgi:hypothetical protein
MTLVEVYFEALRSRARMGDPFAQIEFGFLHRLGEGTPRDMDVVSTHHRRKSVFTLVVTMSQGCFILERVF